MMMMMMMMMTMIPEPRKDKTRRTFETPCFLCSGVTTRGEVRQLPQGAKRQGALGGAFGRRIVCFALQNSAEFLERKKLKNKQNDRNLVYLYSFRYWFSLD